MKSLIFLLFSLAPIWAWPSEQRMVPLRNINERIVFGQEAAKGQFPWQVAIFFDTADGTFFCGGSVISNQWVLTAGHCANGGRTFTIYFGTNTLNPDADAVVVRTTTAFVHPQYDNGNDIALLRLDSPISLGGNIQAINLASDAIGSGATVEVSGWGKTSDDSGGVSNILNFVDLHTITNDECSAYYGSVGDNVVCCLGTNRQSTCSGDSGGPLITGSGGNAVQVAVVNFVSSAGCESGGPSGYARVAYYRQWIRDTTGV